jgi:2-succinyl-5-enolpyruvyl-6-hydroxy-3-cyclohexene-1-carboxylate synthase
MTPPDPHAPSAKTSGRPAPAPAFARALIAALARAGVRDACVSPGSRSTPLVLALHADPRLRVHLALDERSGGFFALGLARATRRPVALVCTSGTAAAGYLPAVIEADLSRVPLVVMTADRPPELRDWGAPQTIDQLHLYGRHARWFADAPVPDGTPGLDRFAAQLGARAVATATGRPAGPVHLNLPFREPLAPDAIEPVDAPAAGAGVRVARATVRPSPDAVARLAARIAEHARGVIACGPLDDPDAAEAIAGLARVARWPVLADPTSQLRCGAHRTDPRDGAPAILAHGDLFLGDVDFARRHRPEMVLRFGAPPTSKSFRLWIEGASPRHQVVVDPDGGFRDPGHDATDLVCSDPAALCDALVRLAGPGPLAADERGRWLGAFLAAERAAAAAVAREVDASPALLAAAAVRTLDEALPDGVQLYVGNSMAVRDLDAFWPGRPTRVRVLAHRGANGIDGMVSAALGAAASGTPTVLWTGDLSLLHDVSGLLAAGAADGGARPLTIVVLNDDGGGIFSHLPVAALGASAGFERLFRTPHGRDLGRLCHGLGLPHVRASHREHLAAALKDGLARGDVSVVEVPIDAARNLEQHRRVRRAVSARLAAGRGTP